MTNREIARVLFLMHYRGSKAQPVAVLRNTDKTQIINVSAVERAVADLLPSQSVAVVLGFNQSRSNVGFGPFLTGDGTVFWWETVLAEGAAKSMPFDLRDFLTPTELETLGL